MGVALSGGAIKSETVYAAATIQAAINMTGNPHSRSFCIFVPSLRGSWSTERANAGWALDGRRAICAGETRWRHRGATPDVESMARRIDKDLEYIRRWSIKLDVIILWRTVMLGPFDSAAY